MSLSTIPRFRPNRERKIFYVATAVFRFHYLLQPAMSVFEFRKFKDLLLTTPSNKSEGIEYVN